MEITELMVDDLLLYEGIGGLIYVVVRKIDGEDNVVCLRQDDGHIFNTMIDFLRPVRVTKEILEHNGATTNESFACIELDRYYVLYEYNGFVTIYDETGNTMKITRLKCDYVHQLQHALKLCNINKQITLP